MVSHPHDRALIRRLFWYVLISQVHESSRPYKDALYCAGCYQDRKCCLIHSRWTRSRERQEDEVQNFSNLSFPRLQPGNGRCSQNRNNLQYHTVQSAFYINCISPEDLYLSKKKWDWTSVMWDYLAKRCPIYVWTLWAVVSITDRIFRRPNTKQRRPIAH